MKIESGTGNGSIAGVSTSNRLLTEGVSISQQHYASKILRSAYQVLGTASLASGTVNMLHLKNDSVNDSMSVTYVRMDIIDPAGGTALPNASNYFQMSFAQTYASGGTLLTPVNMYAGSSNPSNMTVYEGATLSGGGVEFDRRYTKSEAEEVSYRKEGSIVIPPGGTVSLSYIGDHTSGTAIARMSFFMSGINEVL